MFESVEDFEFALNAFGSNEMAMNVLGAKVELWFE